jgi:Ca2+-binding EF-hand superfamily protein
LHKTLDINNDGQVDKIEFVDGITNLTRPAVLTRQDLATIFDAIDINGDQFLSVNEFGLFLQGAKLKRE